MKDIFGQRRFSCVFHARVGENMTNRTSHHPLPHTNLKLRGVMLCCGLELWRGRICNCWVSALLALLQYNRQGRKVQAKLLVLLCSLVVLLCCGVIPLHLRWIYERACQTRMLGALFSQPVMQLVRCGWTTPESPGLTIAADQ